MEKERKKLDKQLDHALEKSKAANHGQEVLETKIKVSIIAIGPSFFYSHWLFLNYDISTYTLKYYLIILDTRARS